MNTLYPLTDDIAIQGEIETKLPKSNKSNPLPQLAEIIRQQGKGEDTILAHINPLEAIILREIGGSGSINKKTGLPQFGAFKKPGKWFKSVAGPVAGTIIGNMILPGIGGVIGGALGGAAGTAVRGRKDYLQSSLRGAAIGSIAPTVSSITGSGLKTIGANGLGNTLSQYGTNNSILSSIGRLTGSNVLAQYGGNGTNAALSSLSNLGSGNQQQIPRNDSDNIIEIPTNNNQNSKGQSFLEQLGSKSSSYLSDPKNLLALTALGSQFLSKKKDKTPEQLALERKRYDIAARLTPSELAELQNYELEVEKGKRRNERNKFLPEERINVEPIYTKMSTPEEYRKTGRWINYYNNQGILV